MSSPKRDRRSRSGSPSTSKSKRTLDLVSTRVSPFQRREWQPRGRGNQRRGRGRGMRRPFVRRDHHGVTVFRGTSQRYFPNPRHSRDESDSRHRRSRSRERSGSRERQRRSRSSSSDDGSRHKRHGSSSRERHQSGMKDRKQAHSRDSYSPETKPFKKKQRRQSSASPNRRQSHKGRSRSHSPDRSRTRREETEYPKHREARRSSAVAAKGKELIPRNRLHKIFTLISQDAEFELDEDISIAIQRNPYAEPSEDSTVTVVFDEELFSMLYPEVRKHRPIFEREEIKVFGHDKNLADDPDFERRVIRLKPGKSSQPSEPQSSGYQYRSSFEITRTVKRGRSSSRSRSNSPVRYRDLKFRVRVSADPRFDSRYSDLQGKDDPGPSRRSNLDPTDLRHELSSHRNSSADARSRIDRNRDGREDRPKTSDARLERNKDREELPDFSRRKEKNAETPWLYDPEAIPKDPKYFMHDDREQDFRGRGRGRFFRGRFNMRRPFRPFRSRGNPRGNYRGRGNYSGGDARSYSPSRRYRRDYDKSPEREWKHDKFSELEHEGEKKSHREDDHEYPHSTSER